MLKELENKVAIIMNERPEPEINVVTFNLENYGDVLVQDYLPTEDLDRMYDMCINDLRKEDSSSSVVERNLLREYTNIDVDSLTPKELSKVYDDIYYNMWNDGASMVWDLYEADLSTGRTEYLHPGNCADYEEDSPYDPVSLE